MKTHSRHLVALACLSWVLLAVCAVPCEAATRRYKITFHAVTGTFAGQNYTGTLDVDESGLNGVGTETLPATTVSRFQVTLFGNHIGPFSGITTPVYVDGKLSKIFTGFDAPSATEGNRPRAVGVNQGFADSQVPANLRAGPWWGYLTPGTFVDGFGTYEFQRLPMIPTSYDIVFHALSGTFAGQSFPGSFDVDVSTLTGSGTETLPISAVSRLTVQMFGNQVGPLDNAGVAQFVDGRISRLFSGFGAASATEGNRLRSVGINQGFDSFQIPPDLVTEPWWGYLDPATFVDGFGTYDITPKPDVHHYRITFRATSGTFQGQSFPGTFDVDTSGLLGIGAETLPVTAVDNLRVNLFGNLVGPLDNSAQTLWVDGKLVKILSGFNAASATEGNALRSVGINQGFDLFQVPEELVNGRWWGYLTPATFVDGFGPYDLEELPELKIFTAVELEFSTRIGRSYQVQAAPDLGTPASPVWVNLDAPLTGTGGRLVKFVSIRGKSRMIFRVVDTVP